MKYSNGVYTSNLLSSIPHLVHGFTTKITGNMLDSVKRSIFFKKQGLDPTQSIWLEQVHDTEVHVVQNSDAGTMVKGADALVSPFKDIVHSPLLFVHTADCTPILAIDPINHIVGIAHAGWKGTVGHIAKKLMEKMVALGAVKTQILVAIGPHIGQCCYHVAGKRAEEFQNEYPTVNIRQMNELSYIDIGMCNYADLDSYGIPKEHIDYDNTLCTSCNSDTFFSYRKEHAKLSGQMIGFIGHTKP